MVCLDLPENRDLSLMVKEQFILRDRLWTWNPFCGSHICDHHKGKNVIRKKTVV